MQSIVGCKELDTYWATINNNSTDVVHAIEKLLNNLENVKKKLLASLLDKITK